MMTSNSSGTFRRSIRNPMMVLSASDRAKAASSRRSPRRAAPANVQTLLERGQNAHATAGRTVEAMSLEWLCAVARASSQAIAVSHRMAPAKAGFPRAQLT